MPNDTHPKTIHRDYFLLAGIALILNLLALYFQKVPGYMDAEYYYAGSLNLFNGHGFFETYIWNTLGLPALLPSASHLYWMPLPSVLGALGMFIFQASDYIYARIPFLFIAVFIPILTYQFATNFTSARRVHLIAGFMAVFSGVYLVYLSLVESFSLYMLLGGFIGLTVYKLLSGNNSKAKQNILFIFLGILCAFMHLTRADGILWIGFCGLIPVFWGLIQKKWKDGLSGLLFLVLPYVAIMLPWYSRNWQLFQQIFPPGNQYALFLTEYNDNFLYPVDQITVQRWLSSGIGNILGDRFQAVGSNLLTGWMIQFGILLLPFFIVWVTKSWKLIYVRWLLICYSVQFVFMSFIFPYAGMRGGFLHSGSAFQIMFWVGSAIGLFQTIDWWMKKRAAFDSRIPLLLSGGVIFILSIITGMMYQQKVFGSQSEIVKWQQDTDLYTDLNHVLHEKGISDDASVMIKDPPGFHLVSNRHAIVVPNSDINGLILMADQYDIDYLILDPHIVPELAAFYEFAPAIDGLQFEFAHEDFKVFSFTNEVESQ
ncbi:MAG: hypothetical protein JEZ00_21560 [Anaerolineaceae bacterium]|nr:hypothetical protein [Anaerolineaceae bacterium]